MGKRIAFVLQPFDRVNPPNDNTSLQIWAYEIASRLAKSAETTVFVCLGGRRFGTREKTVGGVRYRFAPRVIDKVGEQVRAVLSKVGRVFKSLSAQEIPDFAVRFHHAGYALFVAWAARRQKCDIVHILNFSQFVPVIRFLNPRAKIVLHMQCDWLAQLDESMIERRLRKADLILGCSDYITDRIKAIYPAHAERCHTVYNGVTIGDEPVASGESGVEDDDIVRLLFVGRVSPEKGVHVLLDAFRTVAKDYPGARLDIIGSKVVAFREFIVAISDDPKVASLDRFYEGDYFERLEQMMDGEWAQNVDFVGSIPNSQLLQRYRAADIFVFSPVWDEPFGMPPVESMAAGIPVVATRVGGITETVQDGVTGLLVDPDDADALAKAISRLLGDASLRQQMGESGRKLAISRFSWDQIAGELDRLYTA